jgi:hypothetical protein
MKAVPKTKRSKRTSIWLDNDLRFQLDRRAKAAGRSLAETIEFYLRKGLNKPEKEAPDRRRYRKAEAPNI